MAERALTAVIQEAYTPGISTRSGDNLVKALGMGGISKSQVSRLCEAIDERVHAFLDGPSRGDWPSLWIDPTSVKVRQNGRIVSVAVIVAVGVKSDGCREVLGMDIGPSEAEPDVLAYMTFPKEHRAELQRTNPIERLNGEIKRRTEAVGIFPNEAAITWLVGTILMEQSDEWSVQRARHMTRETMAPLSNNPIVTLSAVPGAWSAQTDAKNAGIDPS